MSSSANSPPEPQPDMTSYESQREDLLRQQFAPAFLVAFGVVLLQVAIDFWRIGIAGRPPLALYAAVVLVPLVAAAIGRLPLPIRVRTLASLTDVCFTCALLAFLLSPAHQEVSGVAVALSLKLMATAVLLPWSPRRQGLSSLLTLALYAATLWFAGRDTPQTHQIMAPALAAILGSYGNVRIDRTRRTLFQNARRLEESERRLISALETEQLLSSIAGETTLLSDIPSVLQSLNRATAEATQSAFASIFLIDEREDTVELASTYSSADRESCATGRKFKGWADSPLERAMRSGDTITAARDECARLLPGRFVDKTDIHMLAFSPIRSQGHLIGILTAGRTQADGSFDESAISTLTGIAAHASVTISNARLYSELVKSESAYRHLFERANDLIFLADDRGGLHFANQAALQLFDTQLEMVPTLSWSRFLSRDQVSKMARRIRIARVRGRGRGTLAPFEVQVETPSGLATLELRASRISPPGESPELYQCIARDVTERRRRDQETRALLTRLQESQRLQDEFVANMSHELRTPLNVIIGYADLIADDLAMPINSDSRSFLDRICSASRALHRMVESILEYARLDRGRLMIIPTNFSSDHLLMEIQGLCNDVRSSLDVALELSQEHSIEFATDYDRLYSVLSNLMLNALKFTPKGRVGLSLSQDHHDAVFRVEDTGIGIDPTELHSVFEPFRQVDGSDTRTFGGVGLGLAIVRRNVELLQGTIDVDSAPERGSTFTIRVPINLNGASEKSSNASSAA